MEEVREEAVAAEVVDRKTRMNQFQSMKLPSKKCGKFYGILVSIIREMPS
jgi:hypothetical protein